ncbi:glycosyl transferase family 1 [Ulvibacter sp. MAR_2010_11]|uniref:glycosyltransferase n=1 Tax=Ulvibacter sp. MAR_2010_11 TaxID=1250229 RepID=UPI000C2C6AD8|nr:glycosyltransferase [Ulvibacter sp. MAR_2010_11]PKA83623.1 glycosyl transferase family 1 [Ulvibacter sp. MAR_2010_11]
MKILLIGEYNSSHYTLKEGLTSLGHDVTVIGFGDGFKKRRVDVNFTMKYTTGIGLFVKRTLFKLFKTDLTSLSVRKQFFAQQHLFKNNDIVQLINENSFGTVPSVEKELLSFVFQHNKNVFLLSCGTDHTSVKYAMEGKFRYSIVTPYLQEKGNEMSFLHVTQYLTKPYIELHDYIFRHIKGVLASDLDYHLPLLNHEKYLGMVPNPVNLKKFVYITPEIEDKIIIFHGINKNNYYKKGNDLFEAALKIITAKFKDKIEVITVSNIPYDEYIRLFDRAHILLDQVYAYDQGFNALEAMAKGKVVFTGAEQEWLEYYNLEEDTVAINALPDPVLMAEKLEWLILHPEKIVEISKNARKFIEERHDHLASAKDYFEKWQSVM